MMGTLVVFGSWVQVLLGLINHMIFRKRKANNALPEKQPWHNAVHIWLGRLLAILALITIPLGMRIKHPAQGWFIAYGLWIALLAVIFIGLVWNKYRLAKDQMPNMHRTSPELQQGKGPSIDEKN
ncbi:hypothetical protein DM01DRAFT_308214 [Hesseltinella vesiculosa]|uniref:Cytochrome b561 domain-containing protein n=1 Tax=Hesseltinella vesiculosa TaxID=101127 RepID=A0A1X2GCK3_9FUNG|nr:hypothetical protein DM01DRAFT_308214 [Hesseltinella vesiculosa]